MAAIQFFGSKSVVDAAHNRQCPRWAIFAGSQFLFKYEGESPDESISLLSTILESIQESEAVYTIKFYEDAVKVKANTPYDGSFNFRLVEETDRRQRYLKNSDMEARILALEESGGEDDEEESGGFINGIVKGLLDDPSKIEGLLNVGARILGIRRPPAVQTTGSIGNLPTGNEDQRIVNAIQQLREVDKKLPEHLEKLAATAKSDPSTFNWLLSMLDKL